MPSKTSEFVRKLVDAARGRHGEARELLRDLEGQAERLAALIGDHRAVVERLQAAIEAGESVIASAARAGGTEQLVLAVAASYPVSKAAAAELEAAVRVHNEEPAPGTVPTTEEPTSEPKEVENEATAAAGQEQKGEATDAR